MLTFDEISEPLPRRVGAGLAKLALVMRHRAWVHGKARALTPTQAQVLTLLHARGPLRLAAVADELAIKAPTASDAVAALERKGLAEKRPAPDDGRAVAISLSSRGAHEARRLAEWPDLLQDVVAELASEEQALLLRTLTKMIRSLQERGAIPVQRMCVSCRYFRPDVHEDPEAPHHCAYVDAPFGDRHLRLDCNEHEPADPRHAHNTWRRFLATDT